MTKLIVQPIKNLNTIVLKQEGGRGFFISAPDALVISVPSLVFIIKFLIDNNYLSKKTLEGILEECSENQ